MIRGLDHVVLVVLDLAAAVAEHRGRGFTVTPGGEHAGGLTHNALVGFGDGSYLEIIAFHDLAAARDKHSWAPVAERGGGWADFALHSDDLLADVAVLGELVARPPEEGGRARPDGVALAWRVVRLQKPLPFLIEDLTARELRVPTGDAATHTNGTTGIARVVLGATDPARVAERYALLRERGAPNIEVRHADRDRLLDVRFGQE
ncbi:MAG: VOC family protein [Chloroflexota bacterium]|nr:VOC family protein [Chloroflexota bacterium]